MVSRFLFNETLWEELDARIPKARRVSAAVAYLGTGAASLLPLRDGDRLVVDMSLPCVRAGTTNPYEVQKFLNRGVKVFSRVRLHAKFFILDKTTIAGSANISKHAKQSLDEAAIATDDPATTRRALAIFEQLCTEPVRKDYLRKCIKEYQPPKFTAGTHAMGKRPRLSQGKVWIVSGLTYRNVPEREEKLLERVIEKAKKKLLDFEHADVDSLQYPAPQPFFGRLREGDWLITCVGDGSGFDVAPPARFLGVEHYPRGAGKQRYLLLYEAPTNAGTIRWLTFRKAAPRHVAATQRARPRTTPITDESEADALLRLWDSRGRFRETKSK